MYFGAGSRMNMFNDAFSMLVICGFVCVFCSPKRSVVGRGEYVVLRVFCAGFPLLPLSFSLFRLLKAYVQRKERL